MQVGIFRSETIAFRFKEIPNTEVAVVIAIIYNYVIWYNCNSENIL